MQLKRKANELQLAQSVAQEERNLSCVWDAATRKLLRTSP
ncbi:hypothetical protein HMPREF1991_00751 [Hoylesella loescheii DSM 19665 = JCM 12249 = ATCC 15930]|uniref:Uncharacterized protein n=1 Tax=Hoylesella loescheii DSM 19665 = JCM 12249 = ATCC 15930 TaxID=1122985 RepID=A0A069QK72_HOYLO|nr:hypothetical protein HMPREF1991_00751 [Hoylesella loescheii DSM 19665 = JCM 12249 = ATCC 15930]